MCLDPQINNWWIQGNATDAPGPISISFMQFLGGKIDQIIA